jgi:glyoxylase-like metal-dependent hydrolase (beta-lactamase superfamily II)
MRLDDVIFCGDMVVKGVTPHLAPESINPFGGLDHYLESLNRFEDWAVDARLILNGHDEAISDLHAHVRTTYKNIIRRMSRGIYALGEPLTMAEICAAIYGEADGYNQLLMIEKTGAYVEYLYQHAMIEITNSDELMQGKPARYRRLREISDSEILPKEKKHVLV